MNRKMQLIVAGLVWFCEKIQYWFFKTLTLFGARFYEPTGKRIRYAKGHKSVYRTRCPYSKKWGPEVILGN